MPQAPEQVQKQMPELVKQTDASEIMAIEQELMAEGMSVEEVRSMCDLHSQVTRDVLIQIPVRRDIAPGHPIDTFHRENEALPTQRYRPNAEGARQNIIAVMDAMGHGGSISADLQPSGANTDP